MLDLSDGFELEASLWEQIPILQQETHFSSCANLGWCHHLLILALRDKGSEDTTKDHQSQPDDSQIQLSLSLEWDCTTEKDRNNSAVIGGNFCMWWL